MEQTRIDIMDTYQEPELLPGTSRQIHEASTTKTEPQAHVKYTDTLNVLPVPMLSTGQHGFIYGLGT